MIKHEIENYAEQCRIVIPNHFKYVVLDYNVIMPNHIWGIIIFLGSV